MIDTPAPATARQLGLGQATDLPDDRRIDATNWTLAPYNRWSFQRVQRFTRTARIPRAVKPQPLPVNRQHFGALVYQDADGRATTIDEMLARTWTDGFLVMHRGEILVEQYFNGMQADTLHLMMSCSKSMTSTLAGIAIAAGQLDPARQLTEYMPELEGTGMAGATLAELGIETGIDISKVADCSKQLEQYFGKAFSGKLHRIS